MTYFAAIAAVRIQSWISRTPDLRLVRGASVHLSETTARKAVLAAVTLPPSVKFDPDTNDVAGVCVLRSDHVDNLDRAVHLVLDQLQTELPGVEWAAWRAKADSYVQAFANAHQHSADKQVHWWPHRLPRALHLPMMAACERCSYESATTRQRTARNPQGEALGPDCAARYAHTPDHGFRDFNDLAAAGKTGITIGRRDAANHLATICADGNLVGDFFTAVAALNDPDVQAQLSKALDLAARTAAEQASRCGPDPDSPIAITHFVGGDDIFASVAAPFAWRYVETLGRTFTEVFQSKVKHAFDGVPEKEEVQIVIAAANKVSLGIGMTFAHAKHPIADCRESAAACEQRAKQTSRGKLGAVSWLDITVEPSVGQGGSVPAERWISIDDLTKELASPPALFSMPSSALKTLANILRPQPGESDAVIAAAVRVWTQRVGHSAAVDPFLAQESGVSLLRQAVDRSRWWPDPDAATTDEEA